MTRVLEELNENLGLSDLINQHKWMAGRSTEDEILNIIRKMHFWVKESISKNFTNFEMSNVRDSVTPTWGRTGQRLPWVNSDENQRCTHSIMEGKDLGILCDMRNRVYREKPCSKKGHHCAAVQTKRDQLSEYGNIFKDDQIRAGKTFLHLLAVLNKLPHTWYWFLMFNLSNMYRYMYVCIYILYIFLL